MEGSAYQEAFWGEGIYLGILYSLEALNTAINVRREKILDI